MEFKVLVVDDDEAGRYFKKHILRHAGYGLLEAESGAEALALTESERPDLVLLDVKLPDIDGRDVCRQIKAAHSGIAVLQTSAAFVGAKDRAAGLSGGADSYLVEPIEPEELVATVAALLRMYRAEQDLRRLNETLEQKVEERTTDLAQANQKLTSEIERSAKAEEALRHAQKLEALGQLTGGIAHDFNNLLTVVLGNFERMEDLVRKLPSDTGDPLLRLLEGGRRAAQDCESVTRQLLAFARRDTLRTEAVDVDQTVANLENFFRRVVGEHVQLEFSLAAPGCVTQIDPSQFEAALLNLAVNARDAMPQGGTLTVATRPVEITIAGLTGNGDLPPPRDLTPGHYVCLCVGDNGTGMTGDVVAHAFEPFFTTKDVGKGSGLGLSQVFGFVKQSGGTVGLDTAPASGTRFAMFLPRSHQKPESKKTVMTNTRDDVPTGTETILVVEDNEMVLDLVIEMMTDLGYRVLHAIDGHRALDIIRGDEAIDLLFTDVVMPNRLSGIELARQALVERPGLKVLVTSGYSAHAAAGVSGNNEFPVIGKPYRRAELAKRLREVLEK